MADAIKVIDQLAIMYGKMAVEAAALKVELDETRGEECEVVEEPVSGGRENL